jgi:excisionase family DNA binding protein
VPTTSALEPGTRGSTRSPALDSSSQKFLTIQEVCGRLNLSRTTIWRLMNQHGLCFVRIGGTRRIRARDLETWLERHSVNLNTDKDGNAED